MSTRLFAIALPFIFLLGLGNACLAEQPPMIPVVQPVQRQVTDFQDFTGRSEAAATVTIKPRVTGYLSRVAFKDGSDVKQGDLLFEIDPRPYQAALDQAMSEVAVHSASLKLARAVYERDSALNQKAPGSISQQQLDQEKAAVEEAEARLRSARAASESVKLNLEFTHVTSPINGRIGRRLLDPGNLVKADETALATVITLDPMYAYFDMDEATWLRIRRSLNEGKLKQESDAPLFMGLVDKTNHPHKGRVDFVNNQVNAATGTVTVRGVFSNPKLSQGERLLMPGMFVRLRLPIGQPHTALLVPESALLTDHGLKYVYVIDAENKARYRRIKIGALEADDLRVISDGIKPDDRVAIAGLEKLQEGMIVMPEKASPPPKTTGKE